MTSSFSLKIKRVIFLSCYPSKIIVTQEWILIIPVKNKEVSLIYLIIKVKLNFDTFITENRGKRKGSILLPFCICKYDFTLLNENHFLHICEIAGFQAEEIYSA
jgi:hypothetical protein